MSQRHAGVVLCLILCPTVKFVQIRLLVGPDPQLLLGLANPSHSTLIFHVQWHVTLIGRAYCFSGYGALDSSAVTFPFTFLLTARFFLLLQILANVHLNKQKKKSAWPKSAGPRPPPPRPRRGVAGNLSGARPRANSTVTGPARTVRDQPGWHRDRHIVARTGRRAHRRRAGAGV